MHAYFLITVLLHMLEVSLGKSCLYCEFVKAAAAVVPTLNPLDISLSVLLS